MATGRGDPTLYDAWHLKNKVLIRYWRGKLVVAAWPKKFGKPRSQAQADTQEAFKLAQRLMKRIQPEEWVDAIQSTKNTGMYPRDYLFSCMTGNMHILEGPVSGAISAAVDRLQQFIANGGETFAEFLSVPPGYSALMIEAQGRTAASGTGSIIPVTFNGDNGANYDSIRENRSGSFPSIGATSAAFSAIATSGNPANYPTILRGIIPNYSNTAFYKSWLSENASPNAITTTGLFYERNVGWWRSLNAIKSIRFGLSGGAINGTTITLFGLY